MGLSSPRNLIIASEASCVASCEIKYLDLWSSCSEKKVAFRQTLVFFYYYVKCLFKDSNLPSSQNNFGGRSPVLLVYSRFNSQIRLRLSNEPSFCFFGEMEPFGQTLYT